MRITHIFFDVHDVLVDRAGLARCYSTRLGRIMAERYGSTPSVWTSAYRRILEDWDSYYADLNLSGDNGVGDMWEGIFRTTRALFRLTGRPEPDKAELTALSRELPGLASQGCDVLYADVPTVLAQLDDAGLMLGVISHSLTGQIYASLAPVRHHFKGAIWGADNSEHFDKDVERFTAAAQFAGAAPENCLFLDDKRPPLVNARRAGMQTVQVCRTPSYLPDAAALPDLTGLLDLCLYQTDQSPS